MKSSLRFSTLQRILAVVYLALVASCAEKEKSEADATTASVKIYITALDKSQLLQEHEVATNSTTTPAVTIQVDPSTTYQEMDGFGYTLTGGSALHISNMSAPARTALLQELFGTGAHSIGVSYLRLSVGGSDLDEYPWSYKDLPNGATDVELAQFSLAYDTLYLIPVLKEILEISPKLKLMGSPWSPPSWMKDNKDTRGGSLLPEYQAVYANYLAKYIQEMAKQGITIDALTIQNEPLHPGNNPSLLMLADQQADFIKNELGPTFKSLGIETKIIIYDHNADRPDYPISILNDADAAQYIDGSAFHMYGGEIEALSEVHEAHPTKNLYFTEQWVGAPGDFAGDVAWHNETLIIGATRNWSKTVLEWNVAADEHQNPHTDRGGCDRCLGALTITGDSVIRNPSYYIIAQASKFVPPGSVRMASTALENLPNVAFKTPDGALVTILQNKEATTKTIEIQLGETAVFVEMPAKSIGTLVYKDPNES
ncbi:glucosylceramidase [Maribacter orientalis]|uniref:Glucosylceramidase n=1 Tax=Maribacter orientalis TaxID=228957 RepID=A0A1H7LW52_9FLAO|nr:glycoside hydrolase family 30 beta sandwich domain-containing protein [Maribacter orientalis]SEL03132.1 glucosylceramidase [Maribacter orientalis]